MKHTIITSLSPKQQYEIRRWSLISLFFLSILIATSLCFIAPYLSLSYTLHQEIAAQKQKLPNNTFDETLKKQKTAYEELHKKYDKAVRYKNNPKSPNTYLEPIIGQLNGMTIEKITKHKNSIEMILLCAKAQDATTFIEKLIESKQYKSMTLTSLQQEASSGKFRCFIKGISL